MPFRWMMMSQSSYQCEYLTWSSGTASLRLAWVPHQWTKPKGHGESKFYLKGFRASHMVSFALSKAVVFTPRFLLGASDLTLMYALWSILLCLPCYFLVGNIGLIRKAFTCGCVQHKTQWREWIVPKKVYVQFLLKSQHSLWVRKLINNQKKFCLKWII